MRKDDYVSTMIPAAQAIEVLIHEYGKLVFHTIYGCTGDWEESQDLTQEAFQQFYTQESGETVIDDSATVLHEKRQVSLRAPSPVACQ